MGMRKLYPTTPDPQNDRGTMVVHNKTDQPITIKLYGNNGPMRPQVLEPGAEMELDAGYRRNLKKISPHLAVGPSPSEFKPEKFPEANAAPKAADSKPKRGRRKQRGTETIVVKSADIAGDQS